MDRRKNFLNHNNKSVVVVAQNATNNECASSNNLAMSAATAATGTTTNGTIGSSSESTESVEPPKQPFNINHKDFNEPYVRNEECKNESNCDRLAIDECGTDSNQSNARDSNVVCSVLSEFPANNDDLPHDDGVVNLKNNSNLIASMPVQSSTQITTNDKVNDNSNDDDDDDDDDSHRRRRTTDIDKQQFNGDNKRKRFDEPFSNGNIDINNVDCMGSHTSNYDDNDKNGITMGKTNRYDNGNADDDDDHKRINTSSNDIDASKQLNCIESVVESTTPATAATLTVQNSSEDYISSTDTISSNSIDVKPIKCPGNQSQTASESNKIGCTNSDETKEKSKSNENIDEKDPSTTIPATAMYDDDTLKQPLLGKRQQKQQKQPSNGCKTTVYNTIDRMHDTNGKGNDNNTTNDDKNSITNSNGNHNLNKHVAYNEYVNLLCDTDKGGLFTKNSKNKQNGCDEVRPLLRQSASVEEGSVSQKIQQRRSNQRPRSIVKSPSTQNFSTNTGGDKFEVSRKPRLSIQCTGNDPERPVLHVQFLQHHNESNDALKNNLFNYPNANAAPASNGEHESYQNSDPPYDLVEKKPIDLINQVPARGILRTTRMRDSISSSSSSSSSSSDSSSSDDVSQFAEANPPDGGWGWVVCFASFMVNMIADGITFSFGVIYVQLLEYFGEGKAKTAWIGSLFMAMPLLSGPIASFLTDRYGCRKVTIFGSILASIGFFVSAFTDSVEMLCLTFGVFAGFGLSLCYVAAVVIVAYYFDKKRSTATGLSVCGSGIGTFLFAPLTQMVIDEYGWRGTTLIISGVFLNMSVCGMLMRDLEWTTYKSKQKAKLRRKRNKLGISADSFSVSNSTNTGGTVSNLHKDDANGNDIDRSDENHGGDNNLASQTENIEDPHLFSSLIALPTFVKNGEKVPVEVLELMSANKHVHNVLLKNYPGLAHSRSFSQPLTSSRHDSGSNHPFDSSLSPTSPTETVDPATKTKNRRIKNEQAFLSWLKQDQSIHHPKDVRLIMHRNPTAYLKDLRMHRHSVSYRGAMLNINRYRLRASSCPDIYRNSMTTIAKEKTQWGQGLDEFKSVLMDMLDFSFFTDIRFTLFAISNFLLYAWYDVPYVYLADYAKELGLSSKDGSSFISYIGIINMLGEILLGWFGDRKFITAGTIYAICMVFCGLVTGLVPLLPSYTGISVLSGLFGLFIAANYALTSVILVELISLERFTNAYGLLLLVQGIANLVGPPLAGWIRDLTGNYTLAFYLAGLFISISGLIMMFLPMRKSMRKYRKFRRRTTSGGDDDEDDEGSSEDEEATDVDIEKCEPTKAIKSKVTETSKPSITCNGTLNGVIETRGSTVDQV